MRADLEARIPVGLVGQPEDIAAAVAFFCRADAGFVTGQVLEVHGGMADVCLPREQRREATAARDR